MEKPGAMEPYLENALVSTEVPPPLPSSLPKEGGNGDDNNSIKMKEKLVVEKKESKPSPNKKGKQVLVGVSTSSPHLQLALIPSDHVPLVPELAEVDKGSPVNLMGDDKKKNPRDYRCNFCPRTFLSAQALGGHQNAHKSECELAKRRSLEMDMWRSHIHSYNTNSGFSMNSLYGSFNRPSLGVRMDSMIHKPSYTPWSPFYGRYGLGFNGGNNGLGGGASQWMRSGSSLINSFDQQRLTLHGTQNNINKLGFARPTSTAPRFVGSTGDLMKSFGGSNMTATSDRVLPTSDVDLLMRAEPPIGDTYDAGLDLTLKLS